MTIAKKLIIIFIIIIIFVLSITIYFSESLRRSKEDTIAQNVSALADIILKRINYNFQILIEDLFLFSTHDYLNALFLKEKLKYNEKNNADSLYVSGKIKERFFKYWRTNRGYQLFNTINIIDLNGDIISSSDISLINKKLEINELLKELEKTKYKISEIFYDKKSNDYIISISVLLEKDNGDDKGIIQAYISFLAFIQEIEIEFKLYDLSQIIIISNDNKKLIYKTGPYNILQDITSEKHFNNLKTNKGFFTLKENKQSFIYSYAKKSFQYKWIPNWSVIIKNSEKELLSPINSIIIRSYILTSILIIILFISIILIIRRILLSVKNLQEGAVIIGKGNLSYQIKSISMDELDDVAASFNKMTKNLRKITAKKDELENEIKKRKEAEKTIVIKDTLLKLTGEMAKVGGWEFDTDSLKGTWTDEVFRIHDLDPSKEIDIELGLSFYSGESREKIENAIKKAIESAKPYDIELEMTSAKGIHKWVRTNGFPIIKNGKVIKVRGIFQDITERKRIEKEIKSLAKFPSENPNPVLRTDRNGILLYANNAAFSLLSHWDIKVGQAVPKILYKIAKDAFKKQCVQLTDVRSGNYFFSIAASSSQDMEYINMYAQNITERKIADEQIKKLNKELEQRVKLRTAQFEASNKELEAFAYSVSHDLRAPLRSMDGFSQALLKNYSDKLDNEGKDFLKRIRNSTQLMGKLIEDLLSLSKASRYEIKYQIIDLTTLINSILFELKKNDPEYNINIIINELPELKSDINMLNIALTNLISNAWKFTKKQPEPKIEFGFFKNKKESIYFIKDNGVGFNMTYAGNLFGAFQRLHTQKEFPGTGIGLAIVKRIFNRLGGNIWAESKIGKGAIFYFTLPNEMDKK